MKNYFGRKKDYVYVHLKERIASGMLIPGQAIDIQALMDELNVSRTPVQEALTRLEQEGFVKIVPQVGVFMRTPSSQELYETLLSRAVLEGLLTEWAAKKISERDIKTLGELLDQMKPGVVSQQQYAFLNRSFHEVIHQASGLRYIQELVDLQWDLFKYAAAKDLLFSPENIEQSYEEHQQIYTVLKNRQAVEARKAVEQHILRVAHLMHHDTEQDTTS